MVRKSGGSKMPASTTLFSIAAAVAIQRAATRTMICRSLGLCACCAPIEAFEGELTHVASRHHRQLRCGHARDVPLSPVRFRHARRRGSRMPFPPGRGGVGSSRLRNASMISSKVTVCLAPGAMRSPGAEATAHASDAQDERIARFSWRVRSGSFRTSRG